MFVCPVPKISQVMIHWRRRATQLGKFTLWQNGRRTKPGLMHAQESQTFSKDSDEHTETYEGLIQIKI